MDVRKLATLLYAYEMDAPHSVKDSGHYPIPTWEQMEKWLVEPHHGDCTKECNPCQRCYCEEVVCQARWLAERL